MCNSEDKGEKTTQKADNFGESQVTDQRSQVTGRTSTQVLACIAAAMGNFASGAVNGWSAGTLPSMKNDPDLIMTTAATAWVVSIISVGCIVGSLVSGRVMDWVGRRKTLMIIAPVVVAGWLTIALAPSVPIILLGRLLCGFGTAFLFAAGPVYCSEIPEARLRGRLGLLPSLCITFGVVLSYIGGVFFSWRNSCYICAIPIVVMVVALFAVPESPYWYLLKGRREECKSSLRWLRGPDYDFSNEMAEMESKINSVGKKMEYRELWRPRTRKPFLISLFMATLQQVSGGNILMMFTGLIFISAGVQDHRMATFYTGLVQIIFTLICVFTVDHLGRRPLIIASTFIIGSATTMLGVYYYMNNVVGSDWPPWIPLMTVLVAVSGYCLGCRTLPWLLSAELFNTTIRSTANAATILYNRFLNLSVLQIYPFYEEAFGAHTVFFTFGGLSLLCSLVSFFIVPETKGKTLEQIQEHFEAPKKKKKNKNKKAVDYAGNPDTAATNV